jgi:hypothetical protein
LLAFAGGVPRADDGVFAATPRVWFFDVGQGDASLVEGRSGAILIDAGPGSPDGSGGQALISTIVVARFACSSVSMWVRCGSRRPVAEIQPWTFS